MPFVQVPTTLLAQVDSSVGGKTAVNHPLGKNMIGAFHQPRAVVIDTDCLRTLPDREFAGRPRGSDQDGRDPKRRAFFEWLEANLPRLLARDTDALVHAVAESCRIKAEIVAADEREAGERALLNFGHTFGHAIETGMGYGEWLHGEAVAAGMVLAARLSERLGTIGCAEVAATSSVARTRRPARRCAAPRSGALPRADGPRQEGGGRIDAVRAVALRSAMPLSRPTCRTRHFGRRCRTTGRHRRRRPRFDHAVREASAIADLKKTAASLDAAARDPTGQAPLRGLRSGAVVREARTLLRSARVDGNRIVVVAVSGVAGERPAWQPPGRG